MLFEDAADTDGRRSFPEGRGHDLLEATGCQPDVLRVVLAKNKSRLLCLHDGDIPTPMPDQMQAEEAVNGPVLRLRLVVAPAQNRSHPCGMLLFAAVAVGAVVHHLAVVGIALMVDLPEDHAALLRSPQHIAAGGMEHLLKGEIAAADHCLAELRGGRPAAVRHRGRVIEEKRLLPEL